MKKPLFWILVATILAIVIAAGFFYYQDNPNIFNNITTNNKEASTASTVDELQSPNYETIPLDKLPPDVQLKDTITDYPIKVGSENDKAILRVTKKTIIYKNQQHEINSSISNIEIIINNKSIYQEELIHSLLFNRKNDYYILSIVPLTLYGYGVVKGNDKDYLIYDIDIIDDENGYYTYKLIEINYKSQKFEAIKMNGDLLIGDTENPLSNPQLDGHTYKLIDDKYITPTITLVKVQAYYEIVDNTIQLANREFEVSENFLKIDKEALQKSPIITIYNKPDTLAASTSMKLSENAQIKALGIKYIKSGTNDMADYFIHAIINDKEGWLTGSDFRKIEGY
jgi:hypothetical protein